MDLRMDFLNAEENGVFKKDGIGTHNVTSYDHMYTDFDLWIIKYVNRCKQRKEKSQEDSNTENFDCSWQHLFVQGFSVRRKLTREPKTRLFLDDNENIDSVILGLVNKNGQIIVNIKSKL